MKVMKGRRFCLDQGPNSFPTGNELREGFDRFVNRHTSYPVGFPGTK